MGCWNPWGETQEFVVTWAERGMELDRAVRAMAALLAGNEWAEHISRDPAASELESEITRLVGRVSTASSPPLPQERQDTEGGE